MANSDIYVAKSIETKDVPSSVTSIVGGNVSTTTSYKDLVYFLTEINIPSGYTSIATNALYRQPNLKTVEIPSTVTSIGNSAFYQCTALTDVKINNGLTSIGSGAFRYCSALSSIELPNTVTSIEDNSFSNCTSLSSFTVLATTPPALNGTPFYGNNYSIFTIYVPAEVVETYKAASGWSGWKDYIQAIPQA